MGTQGQTPPSYEDEWFGTMYNGTPVDTSPAPSRAYPLATPPTATPPASNPYTPATRQATAARRAGNYSPMEAARPTYAPMQQNIPEPAPPLDINDTTGKKVTAGTQTIGDYNYNSQSAQGLDGMTSGGVQSTTSSAVSTTRRKPNDMLGINLDLTDRVGVTV